MASTTTTRQAPASVSRTKFETLETASPEVKALIRSLNRLATATTLEEHNAALAGFDEDLSLDTPFLQVQGRERVRVLMSLTKFFLGHFEIEPQLVKISVPEGATTKGGILDVNGIVHWMPHRPWWFLPSYLLPRDIPIFADVSMGVKAHNDKVYFISGKNHNLPHVPKLLRMLAGYVAGMSVSITEPIFYNLRDWYRAGMENVQAGTAGLQQTAQRGTEFVAEKTAGLTETAKEMTYKGAEATKDVPIVGSVMGKTSEVVTGTRPVAV